jgi:hypothetical protein
MRVIVEHARGAVRDATIVAAGGALLLALTATSAPAQQPSGRLGTMDPQALTQALVQMGPMYEVMTQSTIDGTLKAMERPENVERMAVFARRYYEALVKQGFSREEALQITAGAGSPAIRFGR